MATIDKVCKEEANSFILFDPEIVKGLYRRGLIYFDVPVYPDDRFKGKIHCIVVHLPTLIGILFVYPHVSNKVYWLFLSYKHENFFTEGSQVYLFSWDHDFILCF